MLINHSLSWKVKIETHLLVLSLMANDITITRNSNTKNARLIKLIGKWWLSLSVLQRSLLHVHWFTALKVANSSWMASKSLFSASWELSPSDPSSAFYNITTQWKVLSIQLITPKGNLLWHFNSHKWPRQNFSSQYQYNIKQTSDKDEEKFI